MKLPLPLLALCVAILAALAISQNVDAGKDLRTAQLNHVYTVCNDARMELAALSEQACGDAQDEAHAEFLCNANNQLASTHCWVEEK